MATVTFTNLTYQPIAPVIVAVHGQATLGRSRRGDRSKAGHGGDVIFTPGMASSAELATLAETGDPGMLATKLGRDMRVHTTVVLTGAAGVIMPGETAVGHVPVTGHGQMISLAGMLVSTNDGFATGRNIPISIYGTTEKMLNVYDAGSEANNELCSHVPGPPCSGESGNMRMTEGAEGFISVHPGIRGDGDVTLERDWRNPVAQVMVIGPLAPQ